MPNPLALIGDSIKALSPIVPRLSFGSSGGGMAQLLGGTPVYFANGLVQSGIGPTGAQNGYDFDQLAANPLLNSVVATNVDVYTRALAEAPLMLQTRGEKEWEPVHEHPILDLFDANPHLSNSELWGATGTFKLTQGRAYWVLFYNKGGTLPTEIWPWRPDRVRAVPDPENFIAGYQVQDEDGKWRDMSAKQVIHFRHLPDPANLRDGWSALSAGRTHMAGDNAAAVYHASILLNAGVISLLVSTKAQQAGDNSVKVEPQQFEDFLQGLRARYIGGKQAAGGIHGLNIPLEVTKLAYSPDEMAVDKLLAIYETRLCALMGIDPMVSGLGSGTTQRTYANFKEAVNDFWERRIVPDKNKNAEILNRQLLPLFDLDPAKWRFAFDFSNVAALQENTDQLFSRWQGLFQAGGCDLYTLQTRLKFADVPDAYKERFASAKAAPPVSDETAPALPAAPEVKRFDPDEPRADDGTWTSGGGAASKGTGATRVGLHPASDDERRSQGIPPAWSDVHVSTDPTSDVIATGKDAKGRLQVRYSAGYSQSQKGAKWGRIEALHERRPALMEAINHEISSGGKNAHQALALRLIAQTGLRNGGEGGQGDAKAYGASNLLTTQAKVEGDTVHLDFIAKEGIRQRHTFTDPVLARHIEARQRAGKETVFDGNSAKTLGYLKQISGDDFKVHDFRTHYGTALGHAVAKRILAKEDAPRTARELARFKLRVAKVVSRDLGNSSTMARDNYIHPNVFSEAENGVANA